MKKAQLKAQVSIFMLLGLVILIMFSFILFAANYIQNKRFAVEAGIVAEETFAAHGLEAYITECLSETSRAGLRLVGEQGGPIYSQQVLRGYYYRLFHPIIPGRLPISDLSELYGSKVIPVAHDDGTHTYIANVSYGIRRASPYQGMDSDILLDPPDYPYLGSLRSDFFAVPFGPFAMRTAAELLTAAPPEPEPLIPLCIDAGENAMLLSQKLGLTGADEYDYSCNENYYAGGSIQKYLQLYIADKTDECIDFVTITTEDGLTIEQIEPATAGVLLGKNDVRVLLEFPVRITKLGRPPVTKILYFDTREQVRLKRIYYAAKNILREDANNIFFGMVHDANDQTFICTAADGTDWDDPEGDGPDPCIFDGMSVERYEKVCTNSENSGNCQRVTYDTHFDYTDILVINDTASSIDGNPYIFQFAVENRRPALQWIDDGFAFLPNEPFHFNKVVIEGQDVIFAPEGYDPDEDRHSAGFMVGNYTYSGWKETEDAQFDYSCCQGFGGSVNCTADPYACVTILQAPAPLVLSNSLNYPTDGRTARVTTGEFDVGAHHVQIKVCDDESVARDIDDYCDWQNVSIIVMDVPHVEAATESIYEDIPDNVASVEDPITLSGERSRIAIGHMTDFRWRDYFPNPRIIPPDESDPFTDLTTVQMLRIDIPDDPAANIENIVTYPFFESQIGLHLIELAITSDLPSGGDSPPGPGPNVGYDYIELDVLQCLPHRDLAAPYPFNAIGGDDFYGFTSYTDNPDPFQANHACCLDAPSGQYGQYAPANTNCYEFTEYTCRLNQGPVDPLLPVDSPEHYFVSGVSEPNYPGHSSSDVITGSEAGLWPATDDTLTIRHAQQPSFSDLTIVFGNPITDSRANDVYLREFKVKCGTSADGTTRGNICDGDYADTWTKQGSGCNEAQYCEWNNPACKNWPYDNTNPQNNFVCEEQLKCVSAIGPDGYNTQAGSILARAVADGTGQCVATAGIAAGTDAGEPVTTERVVAPEGVYQRVLGTFVSADCNYFDHYIMETTVDPLQGITVPAGRRTDASGNDVPACGIFPGIQDRLRGRDYSCSASIASASCSYTDVELDAGAANSAEQEDYCNDCSAQGTQWLPASPASNRCCGDDENEAAARFLIYGNSIDSADVPNLPFPDVCCSGISCNLDGTCTSPGQHSSIDTFANNDYDYCRSDGRWADCNANPPGSYCPDPVCSIPSCSSGDCVFTQTRNGYTDTGCSGTTGCEGHEGCVCWSGGCATSAGAAGASSYPRGDCQPNYQESQTPVGSQYACCPRNQCWGGQYSGNTCVASGSTVPVGSDVYRCQIGSWNYQGGAPTTTTTTTTTLPPGLSCGAATLCNEAEIGGEQYWCNGVQWVQGDSAYQVCQGECGLCSGDRFVNDGTSATCSRAYAGPYPGNPFGPTYCDRLCDVSYCASFGSIDFGTCIWDRYIDPCDEDRDQYPVCAGGNVCDGLGNCVPISSIPGGCP